VPQNTIRFANRRLAAYVSRNFANRWFYFFDLFVFIDLKVLFVSGFVLCFVIMLNPNSMVNYLTGC
jgi:hypothetical protein